MAAPVRAIALELETQDPEPFLQAFAQDAMALAEHHGMRFELEHTGSGEAAFEPKWMRQVLLNLASCAFPRRGSRSCRGRDSASRSAAASSGCTAGASRRARRSRGQGWMWRFGSRCRREGPRSAFISVIHRASRDPRRMKRALSMKFGFLPEADQTY
jgi:hypothetical protein